MKLKNSYFLLIAMSIFLLVSIGSVCAADMSADDVAIADEGSDIVLANESSAEPEKLVSEVVSEDVKVSDNEDKVIPVTVNDNASNPIDVNEKNLTVKEGNKTIKFTYNNTKINITDELAIGNHSLVISYLGNEIYQSSNTTIILSIFGDYKLETPASVNVNSTEKVEIPLNYTNGVDNGEITGVFNGTLSYKENNQTITKNISGIIYENGKIKFDYPLASNITSSTLALVYTAGEEKLSKNITLNRIFNAKIEAINTENEYQDGNFTFKLTDVDNDKPLANTTVSLYTTGNIRAGFSGKTNDEGIVTFKTSNLYEFDQTTSFIMKQLEVGNHTVELSVTGQIKATTLKTNLTITKANINIVIAEFEEYYGTDKNVTVTVTNKNSGNPVSGIILHLYMPQTSAKDYYFQTDSNGQSKIAVKQLVGGTYDITVSNNDTANINNASADGKIVIKAIPVKITTSDVTMYYNTGSTATIKVTDKTTGKALAGVYVLVQFDKDPKKVYLFQTNSKGQITFSASLGVGKHKMEVSTADSRYSGSTVTKTITVKKASATLKAPKVTAYYKGGKYLTVKLTNSKNKKAIYDANVIIKVFVSKSKYYNYNGRTGANGQLKLLIDLKPGTYKVEVSAGESKNFTAKKVASKIVVKKAPTKLTPKKLTAKKGASKYFKVTVKNTKTKKVISGVKVKIKVYTGKKYKTYTVKTNSKGIAQLNTKSLKVGTHKVVVSSANKYCVAKQAKSTIKITKK